MQNTTFVTGANGLTGSAVVRSLLKRGRKVRALVLPGTDESNLIGLDVEIVHGNILDHEKMCQFLKGCNVLYHVAAQFTFARDAGTDLAGYQKDARDLYRNNTEGTTSILLAAMGAKLEKIVYTSTMACIGTLPGKEVADESSEFNIWNPLNDYMRSKYFAEQIAEKFIDAGLPIVSVNPTFTMGPGDLLPTPVGMIVKNIITGKAPGISPAGVNIVDVDDVGKGHILAEHNGEVGERYILSGHNVIFDEFTNRISELSGIKAAQHDDKSLHSFPKDYLWYDNKKAVNKLGFTYKSLDETIMRTIEWFRLYDQKIA